MRSCRCGSSDSCDVSRELHLTVEEPWKPRWVLTQGTGRRPASTAHLLILLEQPLGVYGQAPTCDPLKEGSEVWAVGGRTGGRGSRKELESQAFVSQGAFIQPLSADGSVSGAAAAAHDHFLPECLTLREVPGSGQQLWADSHLQVLSPPLPPPGCSSTCTPRLVPPASDPQAPLPLPSVCLRL